MRKCPPVGRRTQEGKCIKKLESGNRVLLKEEYQRDITKILLLVARWKIRLLELPRISGVLVFHLQCYWEPRYSFPLQPTKFSEDSQNSGCFHFSLLNFPSLSPAPLEETSTWYFLAQNKSMYLFYTKQLYSWSWFTSNFTHDLFGHRATWNQCGRMQQAAWSRGGKHITCRLIPALPSAWFDSQVSIR